MGKSSAKGIFFVILSAVFFGTEYLLFDAVFHMSAITPQGALLWSMLTTVILVFPFFFVHPGQRKQMVKTFKKDGVIIFLISAISTVAFFLAFWGLSESNSGITSLLERSSLVFITLFGVLLLGERLSVQHIFGILIAIGGFLCISNLKGEVSTTVALVIVFSAFLYAIQSLLAKKYAPDLHGLSFSFLRTATITLLLGMIMVIMRQELSPPPWEILTLLFAAGFFGTFVSQIFYFEAHNLLPISTLNIYALFQPVFVLTGSVLLLHAPFSLLKGVGMMLILSGLLLVTLGHLNEKKRRHRRA